MGLAPFSGVGFAEVSSIKIAHKNKLTLRDNSGKLAKRQRRVRSMSTVDPQCHPHDSSQPGNWRTKRPFDRRWRLSAGISPPPPPKKASNATAVWRQPSPTVRLPEHLTAAVPVRFRAGIDPLLGMAVARGRLWLSRARNLKSCTEPSRVLTSRWDIVIVRSPGIEAPRAPSSTTSSAASLGSR
jgi:hypothetical protein